MISEQTICAAVRLNENREFSLPRRTEHAPHRARLGSFLAKALRGASFRVRRVRAFFRLLRATEGKMKILKIGIVASVAIIGLEVFAQTNFDVLVCADRSLTNAVIWDSTPAYLVIDYDGGITHEAITNLPQSLQEKYHYDPAAAAALLAAEKQHALDVKLEKIKRAQYLASLRGTNQTIRIISFDQFSHCEISVGGETRKVYVYGLPQSVKNFMTREDQLKIDIENSESYAIQKSRAAARADANAPVEAGGDPNYVASAMAQRTAANNMALDAKDAADDLAAMKDNLTEMQAQETEATTVTAYPTGQSYNTIPIWQCVSQ